jgi:hypothetical protein
MSKLTLHVPDDLVAAAKVEAAKRETSVSKLVSDYFRLFACRKEGESGDEVSKISPVTKSLVGCARGGDEDLEGYIDYLEKKHS